MGENEQFVPFRRKISIRLTIQPMRHLIIEGARSKDRFCQSGARDGKFEERHRRGDWMVFPNPFYPVSRARLSSHEVGKNVKYETLLIEQPREHGKQRRDIGQMFDDMVGEYDIKIACRKLFEFIQGIDD